MKQINTVPIEDFLEKSRIAIKSKQKNLTLDINEVQYLSDSLATVMTRLAGLLDAQVSTDASPVVVNMDGGGFK